MTIYLDVPYAEHKKAKRYGAKWDPKKHKWYMPQEGKVERVLQWLSPEVIAEQPAEQQEELIRLVLDAKAKYKPFNPRKVARPVKKSKQDHYYHDVVMLKEKSTSPHPARYHCNTCNRFVKWTTWDNARNGTSYRDWRNEQERLCKDILDTTYNAEIYAPPERLTTKNAFL